MVAGQISSSLERGEMSFRGGEQFFHPVSRLSWVVSSLLASVDFE
jgi:hypothetical protein